MVLRIITLAVCCWCFAAQGAATLLHRELFIPASNTNVISLQSTNTDAFNTILGIMPVVAVGATTNSQPDTGWSMLATNVQGAGIWSCSQTGMMSGWFYFTVYGDGVHQSKFFELYANSGITIFAVNIGPEGLIYVTGLTNTSNPIPLQQWTLVTFAWLQHADKSIDMQVLTGTNLTVAYSVTNRATGQTILSNACGVGTTSANNQYWQGRMTGISCYRITSFADIAVPPDLNGPPSTRSTWYFNPATGSDLNGGTSPTNALLSCDVLQSYLSFGGFMGNPYSPWLTNGAAIATNLNAYAFAGGITNGTITAGGDAVLFDTTSAPMDMTRNIVLGTVSDGIELASATTNRAIFNMFKTISGTYTQYDAVNFTNIWVTTDSQTNCTLFEDRRWLDSVIGTSITTVRTNLNTNYGSFYTTASLMYFVPIEPGLNPNTATNVFERTRLRKTGLGTTLGTYDGFTLNNNYGHLHGLSVKGNTYRQPTDGTVTPIYAIHPLAAKYMAVGDVDLEYNGNHAYGATGGNSNLIRVLYRSICGNGPPWSSNASGFNAVVEFTADTNDGPRTAFFIDIDASMQGTIRQATGTNDLLGIGAQDFYGHSNALKRYGLTYFERCIGSIFAGLATNNIITNCILGRVNLVSYGGYVTTCVSSNIIFGNGQNTIINNIFTLASNVDLTLDNTLDTGPFLIQNNLFDLSRSITNQNPYFKTHTSNATTVTNLNNIILAGDAYFRMKTNDTIVSDHNEVVMQNQKFFILASDSSQFTWAQWLALGFDGNSVTNLSPCLDSRYRPYAKTPSWNVGTDLGPQVDYTGKLFQSRRTAGPYEYVTPNVRFLMSHQ